MNKGALPFALAVGFAGVISIVGALLILLSTLLTGGAGIELGIFVLIILAIVGAICGWLLGIRLASTPRTSVSWITSTVGVIVSLVIGIIGLIGAFQLLSDQYAQKEKLKFRLVGINAHDTALSADGQV